jgi:parallel beta-helix repeat protein
MRQYPLFKKGFAVGIILLFIMTCIIPTTAQNIEKSQSTSRDNWLYVGGSGPGNYTRIQDAVNASSDGDTVFVYHGMYQECNIWVDKGITLLGENKTTTLIDGQWSLVIFLINVSNVTVRNFTLKNTSGSGFGQAILIQRYTLPRRIENICISDCIITNDDKGICVMDASNVLISSCYIHHNTAQSIVAVDTANFRITNCIINNNGIDFGGGHTRDGGICFFKDYGVSSNISISDCIIHDLVGTGISIDAPCDKIEIYQNLIYNNTRDGLCCSGYNQDITDVDIYNNSVYGNSREGISVKGIGNPGARIHDNNVSWNGPESNLTGFEAGIYVSRSSNSVSVENNILFYNNACGIQLFNSPGVIITENKIIGNHNGGIHISSGCDNSTVRQNIFQENQEEGLYVNSHSSNISENIFSNNVIGAWIGGIDTIFYRNKISNNSLGIHISGYNQETNNSTISSHAKIICNNFLNNNRDAFFDYYHCFPRGTGNIINNNFWGKPQIFVKPIFGQLSCPLKILDNPFRQFPWICFDKNPAQEPYDITWMT